MIQGSEHLDPTGTRTPTPSVVQLVASRYTDCPTAVCYILLSRFSLCVPPLRIRGQRQFNWHSYELDSQGLIPARGTRASLPIVSKSVRGPTQHPIRWVPGVVSSGVKRKGYDTGHSLQPNAEIKNDRGIAPPTIRPIKHKDNFTFSLT
jgi:hypothetical protein